LCGFGVLKMKNKKLQTTIRLEQPVVSSKEDSNVSEVADIVRNVGPLPDYSEDRRTVDTHKGTIRHRS
jgi:hypothetical protein